MKLTNKQVDFLKRQKIVILGTTDKKLKPRCILVEMNLIYFDKIIITDNEMNTTRKNILKNPQVFILASNKDYSYYLKISGTAEYYTVGPYFDAVQNLKENKNYKPKGAVVINIDKVLELK